ncbi:MAG: Bifunctional protein GlmU [Methanosaeta sp. PtaU1.Bin060]|nr:MAG: Bifunctional protein GlmU [Methanosaeta sp. PtaU1.Bin060]
MQAIVLAAGEGSRMRPLTSRRPKVMLPVAGKPFLEHMILRARHAGIESFVIVVGYCADHVRSYLGDGSRLGVLIDYALQERQLGTGHALMAARDLAEESFLVLNGDVLAETRDLRRIIQARAPAVAAMSVSDPSRYGVFLMDNGCMKHVVEKSPNPPSDLANAGIYSLNRKIFEVLETVKFSERREIELTDGLNALASKEIIGVVQLESWMEIGRPWDILAVNEALMQEVEPRVEGEVEPGATLKGNVSVGVNSIIRAGSYIVGPVIIKEGCDIGPNCYIRPGTSLGKNVRVGNAVEVKNSTIMDGTKIGHLSYVGDSVIGEGCNFGAGTICANLRHDKVSIKSFVKNERVDSGRRKLGAIMGDDVKTGINTTIYPGTVIDSGFRGLPAAVLRGFVESGRQMD